MTELRDLLVQRGMDVDNDPELQQAIDYVEHVRKARRKKRYVNVGRKKMDIGLKKRQIQIYIHGALINAKGGDKYFQRYVNNMINENRNNCLNL